MCLKHQKFNLKGIHLTHKNYNQDTETKKVS